MSSSASKKRKFGDVAPPSTKYYAVRAGHKPGVYNTWPECQANITGFKGASCKWSILFWGKMCFLGGPFGLFWLLY